jgi:hypothetical protein
MRKNSNGCTKDVRKSDGEEFVEVRHWRKRAKPIVDQPTMKGSL